MVDTNESLIKKIESIEKRISTLQNELTEIKSKVVDSLETIIIDTPQEKYQQDDAHTPQQIEKQKPIKKVRKNVNLEYIFAGKWLAWIGATLVAAGLLFSIIYFTAHAKLSPYVWIPLIILCGMCFLWFGEFFFEKEKKFHALAEGLSGGGVVINYIAILTAVHTVKIMPPLAGMIFMVIITIVGIIQMVRRNSLVTAVIGMIGGYAAPIAIYGINASAELAPLLIYYAILNTGLIAISYFKRWRWMNAACLIVTIILSILILNPNDTRVTLLQAILFSSLYFLQFIMTTILNRFIRKSDIDSYEIGRMIVISVFYLLFLIVWLIDDHIRILSMISGAMGIGFLVFMFSDMHINPKEKYFSGFLGSIAITFISFAIAAFYTQFYIVIAFAVEAIILFFLSVRYNRTWIKVYSFLLIIASWIALKIVTYDTGIYVTVDNNAPFFNFAFLSRILIAAFWLNAALTIRYFSSSQLLKAENRPHADHPFFFGIFILFLGASLIRELLFYRMLHWAEYMHETVLLIACAYSVVFITMVFFSMKHLIGIKNEHEIRWSAKAIPGLGFAFFNILIIAMTIYIMIDTITNKVEYINHAAQNYFALAVLIIGAAVAYIRLRKGYHEFFAVIMRHVPFMLLIISVMLIINQYFGAIILHHRELFVHIKQMRTISTISALSIAVFSITIYYGFLLYKKNTSDSFHNYCYALYFSNWIAVVIMLIIAIIKLLVMQMYIYDLNYILWGILIAGLTMVAIQSRIIKELYQTHRWFHSSIVIMLCLTLTFLAGIETMKQIEQTHLANIILSCIFAGLSALMIIVGFKLQYKIIRLYALLLLIVTIIKIMVVDISFTGIYRVYSFVGVGLFLMIISFVYSRFKDKINSFIGMETIQNTHPASEK